MGLKSLQLYGTEIKGGMGGNRNAHKKTLYLLGQQIFFIYFIAQIACLSSAQARLRRAASSRAPPSDWARTT